MPMFIGSQDIHMEKPCPFSLFFTIFSSFQAHFALFFTISTHFHTKPQIFLKTATHFRKFLCFLHFLWLNLIVTRRGRHTLKTLNVEIGAPEPKILCPSPPQADKRVHPWLNQLFSSRLGVHAFGLAGLAYERLFGFPFPT